MRIKTPRRAKILQNLFNQTLHMTGVLAEGGPVEPPKDQHGHLQTRTLQSVLEMQSKLGEGINTKTRLTAEYQKANQAFRDAHERLIRIVRNTWTVTRQRVARGELPKSVFATFGLMADGKNPSDLAVVMWPIYAETLLKAETEIVALGLTATSNPSADDIRQVLDQFVASRAEKNKSAAFLTAYNQETYQPLELEGIQLFQLVMGELRRKLRNFDASERRQIMRQYGAVFTAAEGEGLETEPPTDGGETTESPNSEGETTDSPANNPKTAEPAA